MLHTTGMRAAPTQQRLCCRFLVLCMALLVAADLVPVPLGAGDAQAMETLVPEHLGDGVFAHGALRAGDTLHLYRIVLADMPAPTEGAL